MEWCAETVDHEDSATFSVSRTYIAMDSSESNNTFKKQPPGSRGPVVPKMLLPDEQGGVPQENYIFADPQNPHKRLTVTMTTGDRRRVHRLLASENKYEGMGQGVFDASVASTGAATKALDSIFRANAGLPEVSALRRRLDRKMLRRRLVQRRLALISKVRCLRRLFLRAR